MNVRRVAPSNEAEHGAVIEKDRQIFLVPTLRVGTPDSTLCVADIRRRSDRTPERLPRRSHAPETAEKVTRGVGAPASISERLAQLRNNRLVRVECGEPNFHSCG
jgi:hypothetical protein